MKKWIFVALAAVVVLALAVPSALALTDKQQELRAMYGQMHELRLQILDKQVEAGLITADDAVAMRERMAERWESQEERFAAGDFTMGRGFMMGNGQGGGRCRQGQGR
ncbi:MAG: DUF2680 domain-containing protein [Peptococcaceae bacterium]|nr:DUF2680 domain-containing protein [Peptococcaceae bacterium]